MRLKDKVCVVTGSSSGIGAAIAKGFEKEGALVIKTYLKHKVDDAILLDVRSRKSILQMFQQTYEIHGQIDVLVNNAGINITNDFDKQTDEEWDQVMDVDLKGVFHCCQEVLPFMKDYGNIINIGSLSGEYGGPRSPAYCAAKAGVMALTHNLARFLGERNIRVNCLSPGVVKNDFTGNSMSLGVKQIVTDLMLIKRMASVHEMVGPAIFLASDESSYMTGQTLSVNGGAWVR